MPTLEHKPLAEHSLESDLNNLAQDAMSDSEARRRYDAVRRWAFCKSLIEPKLPEAANDDDAKELLPNHEFLIASPAKNQLIVKCRKAAHSFALALYALSTAATKPRSTVIIASYSEDEAKEKNNFLEWQFRVLEPALQRSLKMSEGQEIRKFSNGSRIRFIARKAPTGAGAHILIDEFSIERAGGASAAEMLIASLGATTHTGTVRLGGTQRGPETLFNKIAQGRLYSETGLLADLAAKIAWQVKYFPWWEIPALCNDVEEATLLAPDMSTEERVERYGNDRLQEQYLIYKGTPELGFEVFQREFECKILDDAESYFPYDLIQGCYPGDNAGPYWFEHDTVDGTRWDMEHETDVRKVLDKAKRVIMKLRQAIDMRKLNGEWGGALDVGRFNDQDELWIGHTLKEAKDVLALRLNIGAHKLPFYGKRDLLSFTLDRLPMVRRFNIDATHGGHGVDLYEWARQKYKHRVREFIFDNESKRSISTGFRIRMENSKLLLPPSAKYTKLENQLLSVKKIMTGAGNVVFDTERNKNFHGDCYWSAAMLGELFGHPMIWTPRRSAVSQQSSGRNTGNSYRLMP